MLTKKQIIMYQDKSRKYAQVMGWGGFGAKELQACRHQFLDAVIGHHDTVRMTNKELTKVLERMDLRLYPDSVQHQTREASEPIRKALFSVRQHTATLDVACGPDYVRHILRDRFGGRNPEAMPLKELHQLAMTLDNRCRAISMSRKEEAVAK